MIIRKDVLYGDIGGEKAFLYNLGSGGTSYHVVTQHFRTSGFLLKLGNVHIYVDPGIGGFTTALEKKVPIEKLDILLVSHAHIDHSSDAEGFIEGVWVRSLRKKKLLVVAAPCVLGIPKRCNQQISLYHKRISVIEEAKIGERIHYGDVEIKATPGVHHEVHIRGFVIKWKNISIGYASDTAYFESFGEYYSKVDYLILHPVMLKRSKFSRNRHAAYEDVIEMILSSDPKHVLLRHIGYQIIQYGIDKFSKDIANNTGKNVYALLDGDAVILE